MAKPRSPHISGRFSSAYPLQDGSGRILISWSQCRLLDTTQTPPAIVPCTQTGLAAPVPVRIAEIFDRHARHQEVFQDAGFDGVHFLRRYAFIIEVVVAGEFDAVEFLERGIVGDAQEIRQHELADFFGKSLAFGFVALAVAFEPVA